MPMRPENTRALRKLGRDGSSKHVKTARRSTLRAWEVEEYTQGWPSESGWGYLAELKPGDRQLPVPQRSMYRDDITG